MNGPFGGRFAGRKVLVTGHTGFKGAWLSEWLLGLGAEVIGYALPPATDPALCDQLGLAARVQHVVGDVRSAATIAEVVHSTRPDFIFHLAAQSLVRPSYEQPVETFATNVTGTINLLEAVRATTSRCVVVVVTSDKCYHNREWMYGYREEDPLGGHDPYSASKAAVELATAAWRASFFRASAVRVATARAGNVIGGGDWAADRIVPDCVRALQAGRPIPIRNRLATRPWQHVLEPLAGYLWLAACLDGVPGPAAGEPLDSAFNFGPDAGGTRNVSALVDALLAHWPGEWADAADGQAPHEARLLHLANDKAARLLGWRPVWSFERTVAETVAWYRESAAAGPAGIANRTRRQIAAYTTEAATAGQPWAVSATTRTGT
ncbi:MAG: CDP-glucose 4,6-dehydratase [Planctomycetes bacterium]|nr:CDP-glucose 4,6-dehydratase [Planctomycetota bacterium]